MFIARGRIDCSKEFGVPPLGGPYCLIIQRPPKGGTPNPPKAINISHLTVLVCLAQILTVRPDLQQHAASDGQ